MMSRSRGARGSSAPTTRSPTQPQPAAESAASYYCARLLKLDPGFYRLSLADPTPWREQLVGFAVPAVQVIAPAENDTLEITNELGQPDAWIGGRSKTLFAKASGPTTALVTAYRGRDPDQTVLKLQISRLSAETFADGETTMTLDLADSSAERWPRLITLDVIAHIRGHGDVRFIDIDWAGRAGTGLWLESFTLVPRDPSVLQAIEYKGLLGDGSETPWVPCGAPCGTRGRGTPLLGFAIRQKAGPSDMRFDCEYSGYFRSAVTTGPVRNGAPCRSSTDSDPLEGLQVRITQRPARTSSPA